VINNVLFEHKLSYTPVEKRLQPQLRAGGLTSVSMDKRLPTLADRLNDAMGDKITASELARACGVSPAAVGKWKDGQTKELKASNYADAARALGVSETWLRTGKLPREREHGAEESQVDEVLDLLDNLRGPLTELAAALDRIGRNRPDMSGKRRKA
jgi:transcriptional regulator with XRE-family HTH domain